LTFGTELQKSTAQGMQQLILWATEKGKKMCNMRLLLWKALDPTMPKKKGKYIRQDI